MYKIQQIWNYSFDDFVSQAHFLSDVQAKASQSILNCKSGKLGCNITQCPDYRHLEFHNNSC